MSTIRTNIQIMKVLSLLSLTAAQKVNLDIILDNLNEINTWASIRRSETLDNDDLPTGIEEFQVCLRETISHRNFLHKLTFRLIS